MFANIPENGKARVVIIGGGFGGLNAAEHLKNKNVEIVMVDKHNHHTFQPLLYQVATAGLESGSIAYPLRKALRKADNFHFRMAEVERIDPEQKQIITSIGSLDFDYLIIATGSQTNFFGMKDLEANSMTLKSVREAIDLRHMILQQFEKSLLTDDKAEQQRLMTFAIGGAGPTGVELAGALSELRTKVLPKDYPELDLSLMQIIILDPADRVLMAMSPESSEKALKYLRKFDVDVRLGVGVKGYDGYYVELTTGDKLPADTLVWAAGVKGEVIPGFDKALIARGNRIEVDEYNRVKGYNNIFAIGDVAQMADERYQMGLPMLAPVAIQQGKHVAKNIMRLVERKELDKFEYFDKGSLATVGRKRAVGDLPKNLHLSGFIAWLAWLFVHLLYLIGFRNRLMVLSDWIWNYITYDRRVRLIVRPFHKEKTGKPMEGADLTEKIPAQKEEIKKGGMEG